MSRNKKDENQPGLWGADTQPNDRPTSPAPPPAGGPAATDQPAAVRRTRPPLPAKPMEYQELWGIDEVSNYLGVPKQTIYAWRSTGYGPQGFRVGKHLRWRAATVITWTLDLERRQR